MGTRPSLLPRSTDPGGGRVPSPQSRPSAVPCGIA